MNGSTPSTDFTQAAGTKRKREIPSKFYTVRKGHKPGIYHSYADCLQQVRGFPQAQFKSFTTLTEAETFLQNGPQPSTRFDPKPSKYYAVRSGFIPGVYEDWPSAQKQVTGFQKPKHKSFPTRAEAQAFVDGVAKPEADPLTKKLKKLPPGNEIDESVPPGSGVMPLISEDGFDARVLLDAEMGELRYKNLAERGASKMQPVGMAEDSAIVIYTDGSSLGNGNAGSFAGVGVFFGPMDARNVSEPLKGARQTNQRAELTAVQRAIEIAPRNRDVEINTDSKYSIECCTNWFQNWRRNGWKNSTGKAVENKDLVELIVEKIEARERVGSKTKFRYVKGHSNIPGNVAADNLAVKASYAAKNGNGAG